jgi:DegV family protein with EDD domain
MAKIAVISDSSAYLTKEDQAKYDIRVVNDPVLFGETVKYENEDWAANADFYAEMAASSVQPTTSQVSIGQIQVVFDQLIEEGYDTAIVVGLSSGISGFVDSMRGYAPTVEGLDVRVWDSKIACSGAGNQVKLAAALVQQGKDIDEIWASLEKLRDTTNVLFVVDDISHLTRTGRISGGTALIGSLLNIKPMLTFEDGKIIAIGKERQMKRAWLNIQKQFTELLANVDYPVRVSLVDANNDEIATKWMEEGQKLWPNVKFERSIIGPLIGVHTGEKAMGFIWGRDWEDLAK